MRPSKSTKKESAATVVDMDAENTSESEVDATPRSYAAVAARPGTTPATEGRQPPPGPPPPSSSPPSPRPGGSGESSKKRKAAKEPRLQDSDSVFLISLE